MEFEGTRCRWSDCPDYFVFDLDDTFSPFPGVAVECRKNIEDYTVKHLGVEESKVSDICDALRVNYGTTMAGLRALGYEFDSNDYHSFVYGRVPYEKIKTDLVLRNLLLSLPQRKFIFTNAGRIHVAKTLSRLGLEDCFDGIICFETLNPINNSSNHSDVGDSKPSENTKPFDILQHFSQPNSNLDLPKTPILCKPSTDAIELALKIAGIDPQRALFFDSSPRNIQSAKRVGLHTVLVGTSNRTKGADFALESIHNLREALPELWEGSRKSENVRYSGNGGSIEIPITAYGTYTRLKQFWRGSQTA